MPLFIVCLLLAKVNICKQISKHSNMRSDSDVVQKFHPQSAIT
jgi:hypothetical protein